MSKKTNLLCLFLLVITGSISSVKADEISTMLEYAPQGSTLQQSSIPDTIKKIQQTAPQSIQAFVQTNEINSAPLRELTNWNRTHQTPLRNGFTHSLNSQTMVSFGGQNTLQDATTDSPLPNQGGTLVRSANGDLTWMASVTVEGAYRLRLQLTQTTIPDEAELWVYGEDKQQIGPFGNELVDAEGTLWTPSVSGSLITVVVSLPQPSPLTSFTIGGVAELFKLDVNGQPVLNAVVEGDLSCLADVQCYSAGTFSAIESAEKAVAHIQFMVGSSGYICSGGLVSDTDSSTTTPYFLTANHCLDTSSSASSLEAFWDYKAASCGGAAPSLGSLPRTSGSTLLATGAANDFTLLRLNSIPSGRVLMGWSASSSAIGHGTILNRVSHPDGLQQSFSQTQVTTASGTCAGLPRPDYIYSSQLIGGTAGGSSGGIVMLDNGQIVGQLLGGCGPNVDISCDSTTNAVDGSLASYWSAVSQYLDPPPPADIPGIPQNINATSGTHTDKVRVTWSDVGDETSYQVYRCSSSSTGSCGSAISTRSANSTSYDDFAASAAGTVYHYRIKACNGGGCSAFSSANTGYRQLPTVPVPTGVGASDGAYEDRVHVTWSDVSDETSYQVFRCDSAGAETCGSAIATLAANVTSYDDFGASESGTLYHYRVKACNSASCSSFSHADTGHRLVPVLDPPGSVWSNGGFYTDHVQLLWTGAAGAVNYQVFRCSTSQVISCDTFLATAESAPLLDYEATENTYNYYAVKACNANGCSTFKGPAVGFRTLAKPTNVSASDGLDFSKIHVNWPAVSGATSYKVTRTPSFQSFPVVINPITTEPEFWDTSADEGVAYSYIVQAINDNISQLSANSMDSEADTGYLQIRPVTNVGASDGDYDYRVIVNWSWVHANANYHRFDLYRCASPGVESCGSPIGSASKLARSFTEYDPNSEGKAGYYRVKVCRTYACSDFSAANKGYTSPPWLMFRGGFEED